MRFAVATLALCGAQVFAGDKCPPPMPYHEWNAATHPVKLLKIEGKAGGQLTYFPAEHARDPSHPQFAQIDALWKEARPTIAFYEGPNRPVAATAGETIRTTGESGYVRFLARRDGAEIARLEPQPADEANYLASRFGEERTDLFFLLRETARLRDREGLDAGQLQSRMAQLITRMAGVPGMHPVIRSIDDLQASYAKYWTSPAHWWEAPSAWFDPLRESSATGGVFTNDVNRASSEFRNRHMVDVLSKAVREGHRVFAVVGGNHVPVQEASLRCEMSAAE